MSKRSATTEVRKTPRKKPQDTQDKQEEKITSKVEDEASAQSDTLADEEVTKAADIFSNVQKSETKTTDINKGFDVAAQRYVDSVSKKTMGDTNICSDKTIYIRTLAGALKRKSITNIDYDQLIFESKTLTSFGPEQYFKIIDMAVRQETKLTYSSITTLEKALSCAVGDIEKLRGSMEGVQSSWSSMMRDIENASALSQWHSAFRYLEKGEYKPLPISALGKLRLLSIPQQLLILTSAHMGTFEVFFEMLKEAVRKARDCGVVREAAKK